MTTLADVCSALQMQIKMIYFFGPNSQYVSQFDAYRREIRSAILEELGIDSEQFSRLPPTIKLGPKAESKLQEMMRWLELHAIDLVRL